MKLLLFSSDLNICQFQLTCIIQVFSLLVKFFRKYDLIGEVMSLVVDFEISKARAIPFSSVFAVSWLLSQHIKFQILIQCHDCLLLPCFLSLWSWIIAPPRTMIPKLSDYFYKLLWSWIFSQKQRSNQYRLLFWNLDSNKFQQKVCFWNMCIGLFKLLLTNNL